MTSFPDDKNGAVWFIRTVWLHQELLAEDGHKDK